MSEKPMGMPASSEAIKNDLEQTEIPASPEQERAGLTKEEKKEINLKAAIEVEKTLNNILQAVLDKDNKKINENTVDLILMIGELVTDKVLARQILGSTPSSRGNILITGGSGWFNITDLLGRLSNWVNGLQIPLTRDKEGARIPLNINNLLSDSDHAFALEVSDILKAMSDSESCFLVQHSDGSASCPNCESRKIRMRGF